LLCGIAAAGWQYHGGAALRSANENEMTVGRPLLSGPMVNQASWNANYDGSGRHISGDDCASANY
jgi:hypothetical protein